MKLYPFSTTLTHFCFWRERRRKKRECWRNERGECWKMNDYYSVIIFLISKPVFIILWRSFWCVSCGCITLVSNLKWVKYTLINKIYNCQWFSNSKMIKGLKIQIWYHCNWKAKIISIYDKITKNIDSFKRAVKSIECQEVHHNVFCFLQFHLFYNLENFALHKHNHHQNSCNIGYGMLYHQTFTKHLNFHMLNN